MWKTCYWFTRLSFLYIYTRHLSRIFTYTQKYIFKLIHTLDIYILSRLGGNCGYNVVLRYLICVTTSSTCHQHWGTRTNINLIRTAIKTGGCFVYMSVSQCCGRFMRVKYKETFHSGLFSVHIRLTFPGICWTYRLCSVIVTRLVVSLNHRMVHSHHGD